MPRRKLATLALLGLAGVGGVLWWTQRGASDAPPVPDPRPVNVVFIVIDTWRADVVEAVETPNLDAMSTRGQRVSYALSPSTWTAPSMISMFTGQQVRQSGWDFPFPTMMLHHTHSYPPIPADTPTLAEVLRDGGYETAGIWGNPLVNRDLGLERGFQTWRRSRDRAMAGKVRGLVRSWQSDQPEFLYLHMFGGHNPLRPSKKSRARWLTDTSFMVPGKGMRMKPAREDADHGEAYTRLYNGIVEDIDHRLGLVLNALGPHRSSTLVVVTSDHGELLGEHGQFGHSEWVWQQLSHVPLVVEGGPPLPDPFPNAGLADYITDAVGIDHPWPVQWDDPGPLVTQREGKLAYSENGTLRGIWDPEVFGDGAQVFDISEDPDEERPLEGQAQAFTEKRAAWEAAIPGHTLEAIDGEMDPETLSALEALGYMDEDGGFEAPEDGAGATGAGEDGAEADTGAMDPAIDE